MVRRIKPDSVKYKITTKVSTIILVTVKQLFNVDVIFLMKHFFIGKKSKLIRKADFDITL